MQIGFSSRHTPDVLRGALYRSEKSVLDANLGLLVAEGSSGVTYADLFELSSGLRGVSSRSGLVPARETICLDVSGMPEEAVSLLSSLLEGVDSMVVWASPVGVDLELGYENGSLVSVKSIGVVLPNAVLLSLISKLLGPRNDMLGTFDQVTVLGTLSLLRSDELDVQDVPARLVQSLMSLDTSDSDFLSSNCVFLASGLEISSFDLSCEAAFSVLSKLGYLTPEMTSVSLTHDMLQDIQTLGYLSNVLGMNAQVFSLGLRLSLGSDSVLLLGASFEQGMDWVLHDVTWVCEDCRKVGVLTFKATSVGYSYDATVREVRVKDVSLLLCYDLEVGSVLSASAFEELCLAAGV